MIFNSKFDGFRFEKGSTIDRGTKIGCTIDIFLHKVQKFLNFRNEYFQQEYSLMTSDHFRPTICENHTHLHCPSRLKLGTLVIDYTVCIFSKSIFCYFNLKKFKLTLGSCFHVQNEMIEMEFALQLLISERVVQVI